MKRFIEEINKLLVITPKYLKLDILAELNVQWSIFFSSLLN